MRSSAGSPFKLLILHGKGDNGPKFAKRIAKIEDALAAEREIECVYLDGPVELAEDQYAWWNLPPGARSFTTDKYLEVDETFKVIEETWKEEGPFNAILAHSQGAILTTVLLAKAVKEGFIARPDKAILFGNAWPRPFEELVLAMGEELRNRDVSFPKTLHVYAMNDQTNPPVDGRAIEIKQLMGAGAEEWVHTRGHGIPDDEASIARYTQFLFASD